jgi:hypothetical protein
VHRQQRHKPGSIRGVGALALLVIAACASNEPAHTSSGEAGQGGAPSSSSADHTMPASLGTPAAVGGGSAGRSAPVAGVAADSGGAGKAAGSPASKPVAMAGTGGQSQASAGRAGTTPSAGAASSEPSLPDVYVCQMMLAAKPPDPGGDGAEGAACCSGTGSCTRRGSITLDLKAGLGHDTCKPGSGDDDLRCAPAAIEQGKVCHANAGDAVLEGRCIPRCFLAGTPSALLLTSTDCGSDDTHVCGACYDPVTGKASGVCTLQPGDHPSVPAPAPYKGCGLYMNAGEARGVCMPKSLANRSGNPAVMGLPQDSCADSEICMPNLKAANYTACFAPCETSRLVQAAGSKEGGCIPPYIAAASNPDAVGFLEQGKCGEGELCAPCLDPTKDNAVSGACE